MMGCDTLVSMAERVVDLVKQHAEAVQATVKNIIRKFEGKLSEDVRVARVFVTKQAESFAEMLESLSLRRLALETIASLKISQKLRKKKKLEQLPEGVTYCEQKLDI